MESYYKIVSIFKNPVSGIHLAKHATPFKHREAYNK